MRRGPAELGLAELGLAPHPPGEPGVEPQPSVPGTEPGQNEVDVSWDVPSRYPRPGCVPRATSSRARTSPGSPRSRIGTSTSRAATCSTSPPAVPRTGPAAALPSPAAEDDEEEEEEEEDDEDAEDDEEEDGPPAHPGGRAVRSPGGRTAPPGKPPQTRLGIRRRSHLGRFGRERPDVRLELPEMATNRSTAALVAAALDVAVGLGRPRGVGAEQLESVPSGHDHLVTVVSGTHRTRVSPRCTWTSRGDSDSR